MKKAIKTLLAILILSWVVMALLECCERKPHWNRSVVIDEDAAYKKGWN